MRKGRMPVTVCKGGGLSKTNKQTPSKTNKQTKCAKGGGGGTGAHLANEGPWGGDSERGRELGGWARLAPEA
eukprot:3351799-Rhodomonas_salina.1